MSLGHKGLEFGTIPTPFIQILQPESGASRTLPLIRDGGDVVGILEGLAPADQTFPTSDPRKGVMAREERK